MKLEQLKKEVFLLEHGFYDEQFREDSMKQGITYWYNHQFFIEGRMNWFKRKFNITEDDLK